MIEGIIRRLSGWRSRERGEQPSAAAAPDSFVLYRIIGNDLEPRHRAGQSRDNLRFILENEPALADCEKRWIVNRIADPEEEERILSLLAGHGQAALRLPFVAADYARAGWDTSLLPDPGLLGGSAGARLTAAERERLQLALYRRKNAYAMNNNGARNAALADGRGRAKWVLPWDGNCFVTAPAWEALRAAVTARPHLPYFLVPMARVPDNAALLDPGFAPNPVEEPQILMRCDAAEGFDERFVYGRRPKVELFWRLGIGGEWDRWRDDPWDPPRRGRAADAGQVGTAGWVARLGSGQAALEREDRASFLDRGTARRQAILATLDRLDTAVAPADPDPAGLTCYASRAIAALRDGPAAAPLRAALVADAEAALGRGPQTVTAKTTLPPSGDAHDYWHPAPYWWPNPIIPGGRPYLRRDGKRVPGTRMYEPESDRYDRTRLQYLFDDTTALALAHAVTGREAFAAHAAQLIHAWFVAPETRMTPHLRYAQVRRGWNRNEGTGTGIIEFKDLYYFLDAARLTERAGALAPETLAGLRAWMGAYLDWLQTSRQGARERAGRNNHGSYYDLQVAAIAAWLGDRAALRDSLVRAQARLDRQIDADGRQPEEMRRAITAHYCCFNLQAWLALVRIGRRTGLLQPDPAAPPWDRLARAVGWTLDHDLAAWPYRQITPFDADRGLPLAAHARETGFLPAGIAPGAREGKARFDPHDGIPPYWALTGGAGGGAERALDLRQHSGRSHRDRDRGPMKTILHIGTPKTGTTALQECLRASRDRLAAQGVLYPENPPGCRFNNHRMLIFGFTPFAKMPRHVLRHTQYTSDNYADKHREFLDNIHEQVEATRPTHLVLSSESLFRSLDAQARRSLVGALEPLGGDVTVAIYLRRPSEFYLSNLQQILKQSHNLGRIRVRSTFDPVETYAKAFGREALRLRPYARSTLRNGDIVEDFLASHLADRPIDPAALDRGTNANETVGAESMDLMRRYRLAFHPDANNVAKTDSSGLLRQLRRIETGAGAQKPRLRPEVADAIDYSRNDPVRLRDTYGIVLPGLDYRRLERRWLPWLPRPGRRPADLSELIHIDAAVQRAILARLRSTRWTRADPARAPWIDGLLRDLRG